MRISACLITRDEEFNLPRCLASCRDLVDEIIVVDSGSRDGTERIASEFGARWLRQDWLGYVEQKNTALATASHPWALSLDADEELSQELRQSIRDLKSRNREAAISGYRFNRCVLYEGRWIRHGEWYPDWLTRLFLRNRGRFVGGKVHERLEIKGPVLPLNGLLHHYSFRDATDHIERSRHYAQLWAETQHHAGRGVSPWTPGMHAAWSWLRGFVLRRGFLDGPQGHRIASRCAQEVSLKYKLLREMNVTACKDPPNQT